MQELAYAIEYLKHTGSLTMPFENFKFSLPTFIDHRALIPQTPNQIVQEFETTMINSINLNKFSALIFSAKGMQADLCEGSENNISYIVSGLGRMLTSNHFMVNAPNNFEDLIMEKFQNTDPINKRISQFLKIHNGQEAPKSRYDDTKIIISADLVKEYLTGIGVLDSDETMEESKEDQETNDNQTIYNPRLFSESSLREHPILKNSNWHIGDGWLKLQVATANEATHLKYILEEFNEHNHAEITVDVNLSNLLLSSITPKGKNFINSINNTFHSKMDNVLEEFSVPDVLVNIISEYLGKPPKLKK